MKLRLDIVWIAVLLLMCGPAGAFDLFGDGVQTHVTSGQGSPDIQSAQHEAYNGPKARVAVARFVNKTHKSWWTQQIGDGMADQLTTALFNTNRFIVLERQTLSDVLNEQDLARSGRIRRGTGAPTGQIEGAELLITGAVTEFEGNAGGTSGGIGGGSGNIIGAILGSVKHSHMAIDIRVIDTRTSRILAATSVEGTASDVDLGGALGSYWGGGALGGALHSWKNTPIEKALRVCIQRAVNFIVSKTPQVYFHYGARPRYASEPSQARSHEAAARQFVTGSIVNVSGARVNVRKGPGTDNAVLFSATHDMPLRVKGRSGGWLHVETRDGRTGWLASWLMETNHSLSAAQFDAAPAPSATGGAAGSPAPSAAPGSGRQTAAQRLKKLKGLYDQGLITKKEYEAKRAEILKSL